MAWSLPSPTVPGQSQPILGSGPAFYYDEASGSNIPTDFSGGSSWSALGQFIQDMKQGSSGGSPATAPYVPSSPRAPNWSYTNADLAKAYGMSRSSAYQEALSNTSYQRAVKDMQAAGLNPASLFASGNGSGANGVGYASVAGSTSARSYGSSKSSNKLFGSGMYNLLQLAGGAIGWKATGSSSGFYAGSTAARTIMSALNGFFGQ